MPDVSKPLLLVGLPRGITTTFYRHIVSVTGYDTYEFVSSGEILNPQRVDWESASLDESKKSLIQGLTAETYHSTEKTAFEKVSHILNAVEPNICIKDVVQPYAVIEYLKCHPTRFDVIYLRRELDHVRFSIQRKGWQYIKDIDEIDSDYSRYPTISTTAALYDSSYIALKLKSFGIACRERNYISENFAWKREQFMRDYYHGNAEGDDSTAGDKSSGTVHEDAAMWGYRMILGREPESKKVVDDLASSKSPKKIRETLLRSDEFRNSFASLTKRK